MSVQEWKWVSLVFRVGIRLSVFRVRVDLLVFKVEVG